MKAKFKKLILLFISILIYSCNDSDDLMKNQTNCLPTNLQNGVIAFYPFSNGSINDFSGNNYNLTNTTSASAGIDRAGNSNCAFSFTQANGDFLKYVNPTFVDDLQTLPFSISLWYKNENNPISDYELLIGRDTGLHCPDTHGQWSVGLYDLRQPVFGINENSLWYSIPTITTDWKHLVVTCVGNDLKLYINGVLTTAPYGSGCSSNIPTLNIGDLYLGKDFTGLLDDIIIYNRVLSQSEVTELNNLAVCCQ
jgi:hypothetical protein